jgi:transmembrane sensor
LSNHFNHSEIDEQLARYLAGEASFEEAIAIEDWLALSEENKLYFKQFVTLYNGAGDIPVIKQVNTSAAWHKVKEQVGYTGKVSKMPPDVSTKRFSFLQAAATVMVLVSVALLIYYLQQNNRQPVAVETARVTVTTTDSIQEHTMPDSTVVVLTKSSRLSYNQPLAQHIREVNFSGEGFFNVQHNEKQPFIIQAGPAAIKVLGTSFNVKTNGPGGQVEVSVQSGKVLFYTASRQLILEKGSTGIYDTATQQFSKNNLFNDNRFSYATRQLDFKNTRLEEVVACLEKTYQVSIHIDNKKAADCTITFSFDKAELDEVLNLIAETLNLKCIKKEGFILITGNGC